jgi:hypothetical protein
MAEKTLIVFTTMDQARKRLKAPVQILFTLTTSDSSFSPDTYPPVVWKILNFQPSSTQSESIKWTEDFGFSVVQPNDDGTLAPGEISAITRANQMVIIQDQNGVVDASDVRNNLEGRKIAVYNKSNLPRRIALCTINPNDDMPAFAPVIDLGEVKHSTTVECGLPLYLQAYAVARYKQGQVLKAQDLRFPLIVDPAGDAAPLDIRDISRNQAFRLYSHFTGRPVLEKI